MKKKILSLFLACVLLFGAFSLSAPRADAVAGVVTVIGDMVWTISSAAEALSLAAAQAGLRNAINSAASAKGMTYKQYMIDLVNQYAQLRFRNLGTFLQLFNDGVGYLPTGAITFRGDISSVLSDFLDWSHDPDGGNLEEYVEPGDLTASSPGLSISSVPIVYDSLSYVGGNQQNFDNRAGGVTASGCAITFIATNFALSPSRTTFTICVASSEPGKSATMVLGNSTQNLAVQYTYTYNNQTVYYVFFSNVNGYFSVAPSAIYDQSIAGKGPQLAWAMIYGDISENNDIDLGVWDLPDGGLNDINILDPNDAMEFPADFGGGSISIGSWFGGVSDTIFTGSGTMDFTDANSESQTTTADRAMVDGKEAEMDLTKSISESVEDVPAGSGTIADDVGEYSLDLRDYFPFCIPFDIYKMLSLLSASPVAPSFDYRFYVPGIVDQTIEIDLSPFDTVATVLRTMELIAFAVALAAGSKKLLFGS